MAEAADAPTRTIGIDVGDRLSAYRLIDERGRPRGEGLCPTTRNGLQALLDREERWRVVIEAGQHAPWMAAAIAAAGHECVVANPRRLRLIAESQRKSDRADAETLARLGRLDRRLLNPVVPRPAGAQRDLALIRNRALLVDLRTALVNRARASVKASGERLPSCPAHRFHQVALAAVPDELRAMIEPLARAIAMLASEIAIADRAVGLLIRKRYPVAKRLQQVPGVGPLVALTFVLTIGDPLRFRRSRAVGAYLGLAPGIRQSGERTTSTGITRAGDAYLRRLLVGSALRMLALPAERGGSRHGRRRRCAATGAAQGKWPRSRWRGSWRSCCSSSGAAARTTTPAAEARWATARESWTTSPLKCMQRPTPLGGGSAPTARVEPST